MAREHGQNKQCLQYQQSGHSTVEPVGEGGVEGEQRWSGGATGEKLLGWGKLNLAFLKLYKFT